MSDIEGLQKIFSDATNQMKTRVGQLEYEVKQKQEKIDELLAEIKEINVNLHEAEDGVNLWKGTADSRKQFLAEYKTREQDAFGTVIGMIVRYMDEYELYKDVSNKYGGEVLIGFKGLSKEQKTKYTTYLKKKATEIRNYVKRLKDGKA